MPALRQLLIPWAALLALARAQSPRVGALSSQHPNYAFSRPAWTHRPTTCSTCSSSTRTCSTWGEWASCGIGNFGLMLSVMLSAKIGNIYITLV